MKAKDARLRKNRIAYEMKFVKLRGKVMLMHMEKEMQLWDKEEELRDKKLLIMKREISMMKEKPPQRYVYISVITDGH